MGYCATPTPEMGEFGVETRGESFRLYGEDAYDYVTGDSEEKPRHAIHITPVVYRREALPGERFGSIELLFEDISKIRAALDQAEAIRRRPLTKSVVPGLVCDQCDGWLDEGDHAHLPPDLSDVLMSAMPPGLIDA